MNGAISKSSDRFDSLARDSGVKGCISCNVCWVVILDGLRESCETVLSSNRSLSDRLELDAVLGP